LKSLAHLSRCSLIRFLTAVEPSSVAIYSATANPFKPAPAGFFITKPKAAAEPAKSIKANLNQSRIRKTSEINAKLAKQIEYKK
jgi:hypothetical protein